MKEYATEAIVLNKEPQGELDSRVFLFTEALGKISAKVKSGRRITSKLSPHLEPLNIIQLRLIEKNGFQVADAVAVAKLPVTSLNILRLLNGALMDGHQDYELWAMLRRGLLTARKAVGLLGFDSEYALCTNCAEKGPGYFSVSESAYYCRGCVEGRGASQEYVLLE